LQQAQLRRRVEERAQFFFALEKRRAARVGKPPSATLEQFRQREQENLPPEVKILLEAAFPDVFKNKTAAYYSRRFPGTEQYSTQLDLKFEK
jgi:hypothetical protein